MEPQYELKDFSEHSSDTRIFTEEEQALIEHRRRVLSSLAFFIGKDFRIPVELNKPGKGWHWDFEHNIIRIDPIDLLKEPMDYLRFVISHEGGHRRISRVREIIPDKQWQQPGFSFMMNSVEDPRDNNFVAENYPKFREWMDLAYERDFAKQDAARVEARDTLGFQPRFMQAGFEYIRQWFGESRGESLEITPELPEEVRTVVEGTVEAARDSWWLYPSKAEADSSEETIVRYAKASYEINRDRIWPEFKKLVEQDQADQEMQEYFKKHMPGEGEASGELEDQLSQEEREALKEFLDSMVNFENEEEHPEDGSEKTESRPLPIDKLPEVLKQKIRELIDALPPEEHKELEEKAREALREFEEQLNEALEAHLQEGEEVPSNELSGVRPEHAEAEESEETLQKAAREAAEEKAQQEYRKVFKDLMEKDRTVYDRYREQVLPVIDKLEQDLREIFVQRKSHNWETGFRSGKRIDLKRRIQEKVKGVLPIESRAWQRRELPTEKDYAITLLVDLSGSMRGSKIKETFKAVIVLSEVLNRLSISLEVLGFNRSIHEFQRFGETLNQELREGMGTMLREVGSSAADYNDDGWALSQASARLARQPASEKFLIALSDGTPDESSEHSGEEYELETVIQEIVSETDQKLIGLGIGQGTEHVARYYPESLADVDVTEMAEQLAGLLKRVIEESDRP